MRSKNELIQELQESLQAGILTPDDLQSLSSSAASIQISATLQPSDVPQVPLPQTTTPVKKPSNRLSAIDIMFYISGIVLFAAVMSVITQIQYDNLSKIFLSLVMGSVFWVFAYYLSFGKFQSDLRKGLANALTLTGSLLLITGGFIVVDALGVSEGAGYYFLLTAILLALASMHYGYDGYIRNSFVLVLSVLLAVAAFPTFMVGILYSLNDTFDIWAFIAIITSGLAIFASRVVAMRKPNRPSIEHAFDSLAIFVSLGAMYVVSYGDYAIIWYLLLISSILGIFYLSIVAQNRQFLGNASFFLVLTIITISFKYFSAFGATASLVISTIGLLGTTAIATNINAKYFKKQAPAQVDSKIN